MSSRIRTVAKPGSTRVNRTGAWRSFRPVFVHEQCNKCGICAMYCPDGVVVKTPEGFYIPDYDYCKGCGICAEECPKKAIRMVLEEK
ncbi:MAG TPA: 4Fe-4S binding protein [Candidatus Methanoperedenaceae archaeon]|nr:4Fe-4S binding protein [Candidatus Methanoperedenaceae archaeon]